MATNFVAVGHQIEEKDGVGPRGRSDHSSVNSNRTTVDSDLPIDYPYSTSNCASVSARIDRIGCEVEEIQDAVVGGMAEHILVNSERTRESVNSPITYPDSHSKSPQFGN